MRQHNEVNDWGHEAWFLLSAGEEVLLLDLSVREEFGGWFWEGFEVIEEEEEAVSFRP